MDVRGGAHERRRRLTPSWRSPRSARGRAGAGTPHRTVTGHGRAGRGRRVGRRARRAGAAPRTSRPPRAGRGPALRALLARGDGDRSGALGRPAGRRRRARAVTRVSVCGPARRARADGAARRSPAARASRRRGGRARRAPARRRPRPRPERGEEGGRRGGGGGGLGPNTRVGNHLVTASGHGAERCQGARNALAVRAGRRCAVASRLPGTPNRGRFAFPPRRGRRGIDERKPPRGCDRVRQVAARYPKSSCSS